MAVWYRDEKLTTYERHYRSQAAFQKESAKAIEHGWEIASAMDRAQIAVDEVAKRPNSGAGCTTALVARFFHPEPAVIATYERTGSQ